MKEINYKFVDGTTKTISVDETFYKNYEEIEKETKSLERKETRRNVSLSIFEEQGIEFADETQDVEELLETNDIQINVSNAIKELTQKQQDLVYKVFYLNKSMAEIARDCRISKSAITQQMKTILSKLKKILKNF